MKNIIKDFPPTLILQRKSISSFSNGQKIGLYYNDKLKKYFSILSDNSQTVQTEEFIEVEFEDSSSLNISKESIEKVYLYLDSINSDEKNILEKYIQESSENFLEVLDICSSMQSN